MQCYCVTRGALAKRPHPLEQIEKIYWLINFTIYKKNTNIYIFLIRRKGAEETQGAFTPDVNEALSASDLHGKSMQRHDRHPAARFVLMRWHELKNLQFG